MSGTEERALSRRVGGLKLVRDGVWRVDVATLLSYLRKSTTACLSPEFRSRALDEPATLARERFEACEGAKEAR
jgi:hypothetical protein